MVTTASIARGIREHWFGVLVTALTVIISGAVYINAKDWVEKATKEYLKDSLASGSLSKDIFAILDRDVIGSTYQSHFVLDPKSLTEHYIPIYVTGNNETKLYLQTVFFGPGDNRPKVLIYFDEVPIPIELNKKKDPIIVLNKYIQRSRENGDGVYVQDERIHTLRFRLDPKDKSKNSVSIKALINMRGFARYAKPMGSEE